MKRSIISQAFIFLLFFLFLSCQQQDSTLVSPDETFELNKRKDPPAPPPDSEPLVFSVVIEGDLEDPSSLKSEPGHEGHAESPYLNVFWEGYSDASIRITPSLNGQPGLVTLEDNNPFFNVQKKKNNYLVNLWMQDQIGPEGIMHSTETVIASGVEQLTSPEYPEGSFVLHVNASNVPVWKHSNYNGGKKQYIVGTISIGDVYYLAQN